jgi:hypothetical protein
MRSAPLFDGLGGDAAPGHALRVTPITVKRACAWVRRTHRHLDAPVGGLFAAAVSRQDDLACVAIAGRPSARHLADGWTVEITRVASDRTPHAASKAIAAITRAALALGYRRIVSYTLLGEAGSCFRAAGFRVTALSAGGAWGRAGRRGSPHCSPGERHAGRSGPRPRRATPRPRRRCVRAWARFR